MVCINGTNFDQTMEKFDKEFETNGIQVDLRPTLAIGKLLELTGYEGPITDTNPSTKALRKTQGEWEGINLVDKANQWYTKKWGSKLYIKAVIGEIPFLIRGQVYLIRIHKSYGKPAIDVKRFINDITDDLWNSLDKAEKVMAYELYALSCNFYYAVEDNVISQLAYIDNLGYHLWERGISDIRTAVARLKDDDTDYQDCCQHSQQAVEKFLKMLLVIKNGFTESELRNKYGHKMDNLFEAAMKLVPALSYFEEDLQNVNYSMEVRYKTKGLKTENVIKSIHSAFFICYLIINNLFELENSVDVNY